MELVVLVIRFQDLPDGRRSVVISSVGTVWLSGVTHSKATQQILIYCHNACCVILLLNISREISIHVMARLLPLCITAEQ
jgi:hypothetical protein